MPINNSLGKLGDPYWQYVTLLVPMNGAGGSSTFLDYSDSAHALTAVSLTAPNIPTQSDTVKLFAQNTGYFPITTSIFDCGSVLVNANGTDFDFGTDPFTVEAWVYPLSHTPFMELPSFLYAPIVSTLDLTPASPENSWSLIEYYSGASGPNWQNYTYAPYTPTTLQGGANTVLGAWQHVAISRAAGVSRTFVGGVVGATAADTQNYNAAGVRVRMGGWEDPYGNDPPSWGFRGYMSNIRVTKGVGRYTGAFVPPTAPFPTYP